MVHVLCHVFILRAYALGVCVSVLNFCIAFAFNILRMKDINVIMC